MTEINVNITRRSALLGAASVAVAGVALSHGTEPVLAANDVSGANTIPYARHKLGSFDVVTLLDGAVTGDNPQGTFGMNVTPDEFAQVSEENFIPADRTKFYFTPTVVNTGSELVLFDTGVGEGGRPARGNLRALLASIGHTPEEIDLVVITHMHPDHIGGLMESGAPAFPNARYAIGRVEFDVWSAMDPEANGVTKLIAKNVTPLAGKMAFLEDGAQVASGITAVAAFGHTPGHMTYHIESDGHRLLIAADTAAHYIYSLGFPDWEVRFDMDKAAAAETRKKLFGMLAADRIPFIGYHMPFPSVGYVETRNSGFRYVPASYQLNL